MIVDRRKYSEVIEFPILIRVVMISTLIAVIGGVQILGFNISGIAWVLPLFFSAIVLLANFGKQTYFPVYIWLPWVGYVLLSLLLSQEPNALQRSFMMLTPLVVGFAVSILLINKDHLVKFEEQYTFMGVAFLFVVFLKTGVLLTLQLPVYGTLAAEVMTGTLLCCLFAASYALGNVKAIFNWAMLAIIPVIALTRTGMVVTSLSLVLTFAPLKRWQRIGAFLIIIAFGLAVFNSDRMQKKMFFSGSGTITDMSFSNPDFTTSGRSYIWSLFEEGMAKRPWFGFGANASEMLVATYTKLRHPHNDWLRFLYDYGRVGTIIFAITILLQMRHALNLAKQSYGRTRLLFYAGASSFPLFMLFMFTDNIVLYASFFGNLQFTILGVAYASYSYSLSEKRDS
ncbi:MAG: O-antigen ligase family protein [Magnetococcales bacterium]|nr:O-antigen ligase family protein [Magnetococcales bacterium]